MGQPAGADLLEPRLGELLEPGVNTEIYNLLEIGNRVGDVAEFEMELRATEVRARFVRFESDSTVVARQRAIIVTQTVKCVATLAMRHRPLRRKADCLLEVGSCLAKVVLKKVGKSTVVVAFGSRMIR